MDSRAPSARRQPTPGILKKPKHRPKGDLLDKSTKIKREKLDESTKKGEDVSAPLAHGCTPLMYACQQADYAAIVDILNKDPSSVFARDRGLRSCLHYCASSGGAATAAARAAAADRVLMAAPALAGARDADGLTPLHLAAVHGNVPLVQTLLAAGADVNATDDEQHTVVHWATVCGEVGALRAVLAAGADPGAPDQHGGCPLHYAAQMCGAPAAADHQSRGAALEVLRALIREGGARVDVRDADGRTPLLWAASAGSAAAVLALHQAGARLDDADRDGLTALHCAAARGHTEAMETLIGLCGARVDVADSHGCTPLHYAAALGHADATALLLQHAADPHRQDRKGRSPAHTAAAKGQLETVRMLGARGANLWLRNSKGDLPLHEAVASGRRDLVKWLLDGRPSQVNATNHEGRTPLHIAAATDNADLCRLLLDRGAEVNVVARSSKNEPITPLDCATIRGHRSTAKYLQMHGGLPASKLTDAHIVIDGAQITGLPTRRVTSTKIDVQDRITIKKREVVEVSSPVQEGRKFRGRRYESESSSDSEERIKDRRYKGKHATGKSYDKRRMLEAQKSFSDGYDSEYERRLKEASNEKKYKKGLKKSRSRSEPSKRSSSKAKYNSRRNRSYSDSESDSHKRNRDKKKKTRRRSKKTSSYSSESSSSESSDRRSTKRKGKKTSIHIENDDVKQRVNIVKYKESESKQKTESNETISDTAKDLASTIEKDLEREGSLTKGKTLSETETDTVSVKTNVVVTEAQIHMERESSKNGSSELTVTVDAANNVSIESSNLSITHKNKDEVELKESKLEGTEDNRKRDDKNTDENLTENKEKTESNNETNSTEDNTITEKSAEQKIEQSETNVSAQEKDNIVEHQHKLPREQGTGNLTPPAVEQPRKRSFEIISGPGDLLTNDQIADHQAKDKLDASTVSFANGASVMEQSIDKTPDNLMGQLVQNNETLSTEISCEEKRKEFTSTTASSGEISQSVEKGLVTVIDDVPPEDCAVQQVILENMIGEANKVRKSSKDSQNSRKSSIYETESYKVLSDGASVVETTAGGILKKSKTVDQSLEDGILYDRAFVKDSPFDRVPSISDNEMYRSEANGRRKRLRKKSRAKSRTMLRSKSENSERGYESSGLMDSGFEPSPRIVQRRIMSPRLVAYYQQRNASGKFSGKINSRIPVRKPGDKYAVDMKSVTQRIQTNMRRYYCERKLFQHLLELKRLQIRTSKTHEAVLVKRAIEDYNKSSLASVGLGPYNSPDYTFSSFEKFLYDSLRKLQKSSKKQLENLPEKPIDFDYGESELYKMSAVPDNPCLCTNKTHRCFHAVHAYTGIPCSAYIPHRWNHHTMLKPSTAGKTRGFLPKINSKPGSSKAHVTLEVSHGTEKQLIALPAEKLDKNKRYYVTFTVKGSEPPSDDNVSQKSVKSG